MLIGICGTSTADKRALAHHLWANRGWLTLPFDGALDAAAGELFGLDTEPDSVEDTQALDAPNRYWGLSIGQIRERLGASVRGGFGDDVFVRRWRLGYDMVRDTDDVVAPDVCDMLQAATIRGLGGHIVHVGDPDPAQCPVDPAPEDIHISAEGDVAELCDALDTFVDSLSHKGR